VFNRLIAGCAGSNPDRDMVVRPLCLWYVVQVAASRAADHLSYRARVYVCVSVCKCVSV
jgi:hypothetical protein